MKILLTDCDYKHTLALCAYIRQVHPKSHLIGHFPKKGFRSTIYASHYDDLMFGSLQQVLSQDHNFDFIIPVGANSCLEVARNGTSKKILAPAESIKKAMDKAETMKLARSLGVPTPREYSFQDDVLYPIVVKGRLEGGKTVVEYVHDPKQLKSAYAKVRDDKTQKGTAPIIQELIQGQGAGFFAFYQKGELKRFYIHRRLREYPASGGFATAAETFYHPKIFEYGKQMLDALNWEGVAMVEFKYHAPSNTVVLMEINPKFWGSTELGLAAGINFGDLLIRSFMGEEIEADLREKSYRNLKFLWPLDGDLLRAVKSFDLTSLSDYMRGQYQTNLLTNGWKVSFFRFLATLKAFIKQ